ncbi:hypothetical protein AWB68_07976 [Caballeronia choica]|uniref:Uncharacterized protein n=1 Tax=Caballeronia choica TaxID=326476 RepID=A0A158KZ72_9BURK|nr:hypothetical protein AWB68_07976 [Caballeronia choica]
MHFAPEQLLFLTNEHRRDVGEHQRQHSVAKQHDKHSEHARSGRCRRNIAVSDRGTALERKPQAVRITLHTRLEPVEPCARHAEHRSADEKEHEQPVRDEQHAQGEHDAHRNDAHETHSQRPLPRRPWRRPARDARRRPQQDQHVQPVATKELSRMPAQPHNPGIENGKANGHTQIKKLTCSMEHRRAAHEFEIESRNREQTDGEQQPMHPDPGFRCPLIIVCIDATEAEVVQPFFHCSLRVVQVGRKRGRRSASCDCLLRVMRRVG